jgi:hypothetical protein
MSLGGWDIFQDLERLVEQVPMVEKQRRVIAATVAELRRLKEFEKRARKDVPDPIMGAAGDAYSRAVKMFGG